MLSPLSQLAFYPLLLDLCGWEAAVTVHGVHIFCSLFSQRLTSSSEVLCLLYPRESSPSRAQSSRLPGRSVILSPSLASWEMPVDQRHYYYSVSVGSDVVPVRLLPCVNGSLCSLGDAFRFSPYPALIALERGWLSTRTQPSQSWLRDCRRLFLTVSFPCSMKCL